jgi:hypothetical protein
MKVSEGICAPVAVLADARAVVVALEGELWAARTPDELLEANLELERLRSGIAAVQLRLGVEIDAVEAAKAVGGWQSSGDYLTAAAAGRRGHGQRLLRTGKALCGDLGATMTALTDGEVSPEQAQVIEIVIRHLPVDTELRALAEKLLLSEAPHLNATELRIAGEHLLETIDPDGHARREEKKLDQHERSAHLNRFLAIVDDGLGGVKVRGRGTVEDAAVIKAALASLSAPAAKDLEDSDPELGVEGRDTRDHGARAWDALVETCQKALDADVLPTGHRARPRVMVTVALEDLESGLGSGTLETGERLSVTAVRKLACDADLIPVVLGTHGQPLDVGRTHRLVTLGIWLALIARDKHCAFPGCRRPPIACEAHHVVPWHAGGQTRLRDMVLLCKAHHTVIHSTEWQVRVSPVDGLAEFRPPRIGLRPRERLRELTDERAGWIRERTPRLTARA